MKKSVKKYLKIIERGVVSGLALLVINFITVYLIFRNDIYYDEICRILSIEELVFRCAVFVLASISMNISFFDLKVSEMNRELTTKERFWIGIKCAILLCIGILLPMLIKSDAFIVAYVVDYVIIGFIGGFIEVINKFMIERPINARIKELNVK